METKELNYFIKEFESIFSINYFHIFNPIVLILIGVCIYFIYMGRKSKVRLNYIKGIFSLVLATSIIIVFAYTEIKFSKIDYMNTNYNYEISKYDEKGKLNFGNLFLLPYKKRDLENLREELTLSLSESKFRSNIFNVVYVDKYKDRNKLVYLIDYNKYFAIDTHSKAKNGMYSYIEFVRLNNTIDYYNQKDDMKNIIYYEGLEKKVERE